MSIDEQILLIALGCFLGLTLLFYAFLKYMCEIYNEVDSQEKKEIRDEYPN